MELAKGAWLQEWEESERGWGSRPDGVWYYPSFEEAKKKTAVRVREMRLSEVKIYKGTVPDEYSRPCGNPRFVSISDELAKEIEQKGEVYRDKQEEYNG